MTMTKKGSIFLLPTTKTEIHSEFAELTPLIREKIMDIVFTRIESKDFSTIKKRQILNELEAIVPKECAHLITELEDIVLGIEVTKIEKAVFYVLENAEDLKKTVLGF